MLRSCLLSSGGRSDSITTPPPGFGRRVRLVLAIAMSRAVLNNVVFAPRSVIAQRIAHMQSREDLFWQAVSLCFKPGNALTPEVLCGGLTDVHQKFVPLVGLARWLFDMLSVPDARRADADAALQRLAAHVLAGVAGTHADSEDPVTLDMHRRSGVVRSVAEWYRLHPRANLSSPERRFIDTWAEGSGSQMPRWPGAVPRPVDFEVEHMRYRARIAQLQERIA